MMVYYRRHHFAALFRLRYRLTLLEGDVARVACQAMCEEEKTVPTIPVIVQKFSALTRIPLARGTLPA